MADKIVNIQASTPGEKEKDFQQVHDIVVFHRSEVARKVNTEMLQMAWEIGQLRAYEKTEPLNVFTNIGN